MLNIAKFISSNGHPVKVGSRNAMQLGETGIRASSVRIWNGKESSYFESKIVLGSIRTSTRGISCHNSQNTSKPGHINMDFPTAVPEDNTEVTGDAPTVFIESSYNSKKRIGESMIRDAEEKDRIIPGQTVLVEYITGNSEMALVPVAKKMGYDLIVVMRKLEKEEKKDMVKAYGAQLHLTQETPKGYKPLQAMREEAKKICDDESRNYFLLDQFDSRLNHEFHYEITGPEIWNRTRGNVDILVSTIGTGGTLIGAGRFLKEKKTTIKVLGVDYPKGEYEHLHSRPDLERMSKEDRLPKQLELADKVVDGIIQVSGDEGNKMTQLLKDKYGLQVGFSSGCAVAGAVKESKKPENKGKLIACRLSFPSKNDKGDDNDKYLLICMECQGRERKN